MNTHALDNPLKLLKDELEATLGRILEALEAYIEDPEDDARLSEVAAWLDQIRGGFFMLEQREAAALSKELVTLARALAAGEVGTAEAGRDALLRAVLQLPRFLEWLQREGEKPEFLFIPLRNQIRAVLGQPPVGCEAGRDGVPAAPLAQLGGLAQRLRPTLQRAMLALLRQRDQAQSLQIVAGVCAELKVASADAAGRRFWELAEGLAEEWRTGGVQPGQAGNLLLRDLDRQLKRLSDGESIAWDQDRQIEPLRRQLGELLSVSDSGRARLARQAAEHDEAPAAAAADAAPGLLDIETLLQIAAFLKESMALVKDAVDRFARDGERRLAVLQGHEQRLHEIANVLTLLDMEVPAGLAREISARLGHWLTSAQPVDETAVAQLAAELILVENSLDNISEFALNRQLAANVTGDLDEAGKCRLLTSLEHRRSRRAVALEAITSMTRARERMDSREQDAALWQPLSIELANITGVFAMLECRRPTRQTQRLQRMAAALATGAAVRDQSALLAGLAEVLVSLEYFLQLLAENKSLEAAVLDQTDARLTQLEGLFGAALPALPDAIAWLEEAVRSTPVEKAITAAEELTPVTAEPQVPAPTTLDVAAPMPETLGLSLAEFELDALAAPLEPAVDRPSPVSPPTPAVESKATVPAEDTAPPATDDFTLEFIDFSEGALLESVAQEAALPAVDALTLELDLEGSQATTGESPPGDSALQEPATLDVVEPVGADLHAALGALVQEEAELVAQPAPAAATPASAAVPVIDPEFVEIFFEEAQGELDSIRDGLAVWQGDLGNYGVLTTIRRSFHTLKGSGRMVGQNIIGEFAWRFERLLNRVLERQLEPTPSIAQALERALQLLQPVIAAQQVSVADAQALAQLQDHADALWRGELPRLDAAAEPVAPADAALVAVSPRPAEIPLPAAPDAVAEVAVVPQPEVQAESPAVTAEVVRSVEFDPGSAAPIWMPTPVPAPAAESAEVDPELVEVFFYEAAEILDHSDTILQRWGSDRANLELLNDLRREMHTLKGSARMAGFLVIGDLAHTLESLLDAVAQGAVQPDFRVLDLLQQALDSLNTLLTQAQHNQPLAANDALLAAFQRLLAGEAEHLVEPPAAAPAAAPPALDIERDADPELIAIFLQEAGEIVNTSDAVLQQWSADPGNQELLNDLRREMHTLKGSARMAGFPLIGNLAHAMESLLDAAASGQWQADARAMALLQRALDAHNALLGCIHSRQPLFPVDELIQALQSLLHPGAAAAPSLETQAAATVAPASAAPATPTSTVPVEVAPAEPGERPGLLAAGGEDTIRVSAKLLNNLTNQMGESSIFRARVDQGVGALRFSLNDLAQTVLRLRQQLRRLEIETEAQIMFRYEGSKDSYEGFDPLELDRFSELQQLSRSLMEIVDDLNNIQNTLEDQAQDMSFLLDQQAKVNKEIQQSLMRTRMVRFSSVVPRLRRVVRQAAQELGKQAELVIEGSESEVDRTVLENMVAPLEHLLRNALSHGIEAPERRRALGKPETGTIRIDLRREGAELVLVVRDDGAGLDYEAIRAKGVALGMLRPAQRVSEQELIDLLLRPGFSTASEVTQIAGRGVGMDVVNDAIKAMRGALLVQSQAGAGATFIIRLPFSLALTQALLIQAAGEIYAVPLLSIEAVTRLNEGEYKTYLQGQPVYHEYNANRYPLHSLSRLFGGSAEGGAGERPPAILFRSGESSAALQVDAVIGNQEIIVKPVGRQLQGVPGISGATVLGDGRVVVVLELAALVRNLASQAQRQTEERLHVPAHQEPQHAGISAMVIDDSITMRKVTARFLERHGIRVTVAKDGVEAVGLLEQQVPDLAILDIEMPRMDGFEVVAHIRNQPHLRHLKVIMVTSRSGEKHRERATKLGVDDYLIKPYQEEEMMGSIRKLLGQRAQELIV
ncbi:MAG TPA: Hpt domain-containing protein [Candidatus Competibacteraceae bacterium]|nr:Hpt domain-containing protein [Candidatus Competibacteraceae bacterium]